MRIGMECSIRQTQELRQHMTLIKVCPFCGEENDIGALSADMGKFFNSIVPLCWACKKPLYRSKEAYLDFQRRCGEGPA